jgi:hypothetical protein
MRAPEPAAAFIKPYLEKIEANAEYMAAFTCPLKAGESAPCQPVGPRGEPAIPLPFFGLGECPVREQENCQPHRDYLLALEEIADRQWRAWARKEGIPAVLLDASLNRSDPSEAMTRLNIYLATTFKLGGALILSGNSGLGKSHAAVAALRQEFARSAGFFYFPAWVGALLASDTRGEAITRATTVRLAVFDDVGREYLKVGGLADAKIDEMLFFREGNRLPSVFTTNLDSGELQERLSRPSWDRLKSWASFYRITGKSRRSRPGEGTTR